MKRTPLNRMSQKKRAEIAETKAIRHAYIDAGGMCERCNIQLATDPHEIGAGSARHLAVYELNAMLFVCRSCHEKLQGAPIPEQIAVRTRAMIRAMNFVRGRTCVNSEQVGLELIRYEENKPRI